MIRPAAYLLLAAACGCAGAPAPAPPAGERSRAPYVAAPAGRHGIDVRIDAGAARDLLAFLSQPQYRVDDAKRLEELPAVRLALQDSGRTAEVFERDLATAFEDEAGSAVFDFHSIRSARPRWEALLSALPAREADLARMSAERAAALLPADRPVRTSLQVFLTFGLAGLADHLVVTIPDGAEVMIVDLARALGDSANESVENQIERVARLIAGEAFRQAWRAYRTGSPNWTSRDTSLGLLEPLLQVTTELGPVALFHVDENFFPLSVWLKERLYDLRVFASSYACSSCRTRSTAEIRRLDFGQRVAGPGGAFLSDGIIQNLGLDAFRTALASGPKAFFVAYDQAQQKSRDLIPLSEVIRNRLKGSKLQVPRNPSGS